MSCSSAVLLMSSGWSEAFIFTFLTSFSNSSRGSLEGSKDVFSSLRRSLSVLPCLFSLGAVFMLITVH